MTNTKQAAAFKREALKRSEKAKKGWETRKENQIKNAINDLDLASENIELKSKNEALLKEVEFLKSKKQTNSEKEIWMDISKQIDNQGCTAENLRIQLNQLKIDKQKELSRFDSLIQCKEAEIGDFIKKAKSDIETLS